MRVRASENRIGTHAEAREVNVEWVVDIVNFGCGEWWHV